MAKETYIHYTSATELSSGASVTLSSDYQLGENKLQRDLITAFGVVCDDRMQLQVINVHILNVLPCTRFDHLLVLFKVDDEPIRSDSLSLPIFGRCSLLGGSKEK